MVSRSRVPVSRSTPSHRVRIWRGKGNTMERHRNKRTHRHRYRDIRSGVGSLIVYLMKNRVFLCLKNKRDIRLWTLESVKSLEPIVVAFYTLTWLNFGAQWSICASGKIHFKIHSKTRARSSCRFLSVNFWFSPEATSRPDTVCGPVLSECIIHILFTRILRHVRTWVRIKLQFHWTIEKRTK